MMTPNTADSLGYFAKLPQVESRCEYSRQIAELADELLIAQLRTRAARHHSDLVERDLEMRQQV